GEMEFCLPLASETVRRLACDSSVMRVLFDAESLPIDVGRSRRLVDGGLRKALMVRDKSCQWPGCERPASWCDGHQCEAECGQPIRNTSWTKRAMTRTATNVPTTYRVTRVLNL